MNCFYFMNTAEVQIPETDEVFADLLNEQFGDNGLIGSVVKGTIIKINPDFVTVDVGLKSEGRIPVREFGQNPELKVGDTVEVYVDRYEDREGNIVLSREKARREESRKAGSCRQKARSQGSCPGEESSGEKGCREICSQERRSRKARCEKGCEGPGKEGCSKARS